MSNQPVKRLSFNRVIIDIPDILKNSDGELSSFAIPLLEFLRSTSIWIPFETSILWPSTNCGDAVCWFRDKTQEHDFSFISHTFQNRKSVNFTKLTKDSIFITNNTKHKRLKNVVFLDDILLNKERRFRYLIRYLKQVFYMCPRTLIRKAKNNDKEAMEWVIARIKLYLSGLIASLYVRFNSQLSESCSKYRKETIDQIINEKILETIARWNEKKLPIEKLAFIMVREAFKSSSFKNYKAEALETELINCPPDKRIEVRVANKFLPKETKEKIPQFTEEIHKILNNSLTFLEKRILDLKLGLNGGTLLKFPEIAEHFAKDGLSYSEQAIYQSYRRAIKKLQSSKELQTIWASQGKSL